MSWTVGLLIILLNIYDAFFTQYVVSKNLAVELNPLVDIFINLLGNWFVLPKILLGFFAGIMVAVTWKNYKIARYGGIAVLVIYVLLTIYHIVVTIIYY